MRIYEVSINMPKKKLTKAQVKSKLLKTANNVYDITLEKMGHPESFVPMSVSKLFALHKDIMNAYKRVK